ncbi:hypothetical protein niasHT_023139 [Heterodera trifolii]|uniref:Uncharacterized protein n=1 Tax=Heterodera trifolii TaxID=157864 RepID=A0ABD2JDT9_9BILA
MVAFNVQLDSHGDIRGRHLPLLLHSVLSGMATNFTNVQQQQQLSVTECWSMLANIVSCRRLLAEITQNNLSMVFEQIHDDAFDGSPTKKGIKCNEELAEADSVLLHTDDEPNHHLNQHQQQSQQMPTWLCSVLRLIDPPSWSSCTAGFDFVLRNQLFDLLLYMCVRSASMLEQHSAVFGRAQSQRRFAGQQQQQEHYHQNQQPKQKTTTTVLLLKPFLSMADLQRIDQEALCRKAAAVLWRRFADDDGTGMDIAADTLLHPIALLLLRLHSRRVSETSSEVEDIVVAELTSSNKVLSGTQKLVERCLAACLRLLAVLFDWYCAARERRLFGVLVALFALMRDFADFPFYSLQLLHQDNICRSLSEFAFEREAHINELQAVCNADIESVKQTKEEEEQARRALEKNRKELEEVEKRHEETAQQLKEATERRKRAEEKREKSGRVWREAIFAPQDKSKKGLDEEVPSSSSSVVPSTKTAYGVEDILNK